MATSARATEFYGRYGNPTVADFESAIADLEGAEAARAYASGMGAVTGTVLAICSPGDHIVTQRQLYAGTQLVFNSMCPRLGIDVTFVDATDPDAWDCGDPARQDDVVLRREPGEPTPGARRPRAVRRDRRAGHGRRLDIRDAARSATPRVRDRPRDPFGDQGHRRPQRRVARRRGRERRADRLAVGLRRAPGCERQPVRRAERHPRPPHARPAASPADRDRDAARRSCSTPTSA